MRGRLFDLPAAALYMGWVVVRAAVAFFPRSYIHPDEVLQSVEVAVASVWPPLPALHEGLHPSSAPYSIPWEYNNCSAPARSSVPVYVHRRLRALLATRTLHCFAHVMAASPYLQIFLGWCAAHVDEMAAARGCAAVTRHAPPPAPCLAMAHYSCLWYAAPLRTRLRRMTKPYHRMFSDSKCMHLATLLQTRCSFRSAVR